MTRLQREVSRKAKNLGCSTKYNEQDGSIQITFDCANVCRLYSDDTYTYKNGEYQNEKQKNTL